MATTFETVRNTQDPATGQPVRSTTSKPGVAIEKPFDPAQFEGLTLTEREAIVLKWVPEVYGGTPDPVPGDTVSRAGKTWTVKAVARVAPDGVTILANVVVAR